MRKLSTASACLTAALCCAMVTPGVSGTHMTLSAAQRACGPPTVHVPHNRTSTTATIVHNPCRRWWIWPWASFIDQDGNPDRDSVKGVKSGAPVVEEPGARSNQLGGYGFSGANGRIHNRQTYG